MAVRHYSYLFRKHGFEMSLGVALDLEHWRCDPLWFDLGVLGFSVEVLAKILGLFC
jgi:hypothetical protein